VDLKWDDEEDGRMPALPEQGVNLLADDWSNVSAWHALLEHAEAQPCRFVLSQGSYQEANPSRLTGSLMARNLLLTCVATSAISGMGKSWLLESKGLWPQAEHPRSSVSNSLCKMATRCIELINLFLAEDEESLKSLYHACERELRNADVDGEAGRVAQERVRQALRNARDHVLCALK
jgi:hypothetical protein